MRHDEQFGAASDDPTRIVIPNESASLLAEEPRDLSAPLALRAVELTRFGSLQPLASSLQLPELARHTMPSYFRRISLKTNDRHPRRVTHFFKLCDLSFSSALRLGGRAPVFGVRWTPPESRNRTWEIKHCARCKKPRPAKILLVLTRASQSRRDAKSNGATTPRKHAGHDISCAYNGNCKSRSLTRPQMTRTDSG
jgi:hypothetical protein